MTLQVSASEVRTFTSVVPNLNRKSAHVLSLYDVVRYTLKEIIDTTTSFDNRGRGGIK